MQKEELSEKVKLIIKNAAKKMTLAKRREYLAIVTLEFFDGNTRKAEREFGWGRNTIQKGIREKATGIKCAGSHSERGRKKTEDKNHQLAEDVKNLVDPKSQADPKFQTGFAYTRITAKAVRDELIKKKDMQMKTCRVRTPSEICSTGWNTVLKEFRKQNRKKNSRN